MSDLIKMWNEIEAVLHEGEVRRYACGCMIIFQGKDKLPAYVRKCKEGKWLSDKFHQARGTYAKYMANESWSKMRREYWRNQVDISGRNFSQHLLGQTFEIVPQEESGL